MVKGLHAERTQLRTLTVRAVAARGEVLKAVDGRYFFARPLSRRDGGGAFFRSLAEFAGRFAI